MADITFINNKIKTTEILELIHADLNSALTFFALKISQKHNL